MARPPTVTIEHPTTHQRVAHSVPVHGMYRDLPSDHSIWTVTIPDDVGPLVHPQSGPAHLEPASERWSSTAYVGDRVRFADTGRQVAIIPVVTSPDADRMFREYLDRAISTDSFPGLPLPNGTIPVDAAKVVVIRDDHGLAKLSVVVFRSRRVVEIEGIEVIGPRATQQFLLFERLAAAHVQDVQRGEAPDNYSWVSVTDWDSAVSGAKKRSVEQLKTYVHRIRRRAHGQFGRLGIRLGEDELIQTSPEGDYAYRINPTQVQIRILP